MSIGSDVADLEVKEQNTGNPPVNGRVQLQVRVVDHTLDVLGVHFNYKVSNSEDENLDRLERPK